MNSFIDTNNKSSSSESNETPIQDALSWSMLEEEGKNMEELKELYLELLFAGHATVASAANTLIYHLAR